jgi:hypothetical protein
LPLLGSWFAMTLSALLATEAGPGVDRAGPDVDRAAPQPAPPPHRSLLDPLGAQPVALPEVDLKDANDGSGDLLYQGNGFSARVAPDGSVAFKDKNLTGSSPIPWFPMKARMPVPSLQSSVVSLLQGRRPPKPPPSELDVGLPPPETKQVNPDVSRYRPDPRENCRECTFNSLAVPVQGLTRFDAADQLEQFSGKDPHRYQKAQFLAATSERRIRMAARLHASNISRASDELPGRLEAIACDARLTYRERRAIITALSAEMDTNTPEGASARKSITAFLTRFDGGSVVCPAVTTGAPPSIRFQPSTSIPR